MLIKLEVLSKFENKDSYLFGSYPFFFFSLNSGFLDFEDSIEVSQYKLGLYVILWRHEGLITMHTIFSSFPITSTS